MIPIVSLFAPLWFLAPPLQLTQPVRNYADVLLSVDAEKIVVAELHKGRFDKPTALPRYRGRFLLRALAGKKVLEEVRVDLPLLADAETDDASDEARKFAVRLRQNASVKARVRVPLPDGADAIAVVDTKTGRAVTASLSAATAPSPHPAAAKGAPRAR